jgi:hypothetical protein
MIDPHTLELGSTLFQLIAAWRAAAKGHGEAIDAVAFRIWLENTAFPALRDRADETLQAVTRIGADQRTQLEELIQKINDLYEAVMPMTAMRIWGALKPLDRTVLLRLYDVMENSSTTDIAVVADDTKTPAEEVYNSAKYLKEKGWAHIHESTQSRRLALTPSGFRLAWEIAEPRAREIAERIRAALPQGSETLTIGMIAAKADAPVSVVHALLKGWADLHSLRLQPIDGGLARWRVGFVQEGLRRGDVIRAN